MSALDRPTADELRRGEIAAAVKNGRITPQEAEAFVRTLEDRRPPQFVRSALRAGIDPLILMASTRRGAA